jgi:hypothetical protein
MPLSILYLLTRRCAAKDALRYGEAVDKAGNSYGGFGNLIGMSEAATRDGRIRRVSHQDALRIIGRAVMAAVVTGAGIWLLRLAKDGGQEPPEIAVELGTAFALSGWLWWVSRQLRGVPPEGKTDISALLILTGLGALTVSWALTQGATLSQSMLVAGSALTTVWIFIGLEKFFALKEDGTPLWVLILSLPILFVLFPILIVIGPFLIWTLRGIERIFPGDSPEPLDAEKRMEDLRLDYELDSLDSGEAWHYEETGRPRFEPYPAEVERHLGVSFPEGFAEWIDISKGVTQKWIDESLISIWPWGAIREHPVRTDNSLVFFADCDLDGRRSYIAIDLRQSASKGSVIRHDLDQHGSPPLWDLKGHPQMLATSFANWSNLITTSRIQFAAFKK